MRFVGVAGEFVEVTSVTGPVEEGVGDHGDEALWRDACGVEPKMMGTVFWFFAAEADLKDRGEAGGL